MAGRKPILDEELVREAEQLIGEGHYQKTIAEYFGIHEATWYDWLSKGERYSELSDEEQASTPNAYIYIELYQAVKRANSRAEMDAVNAIQKHGRKSWQAYAWFLERRFRDRWGRVMQDESGESNKGQLDSFLKGLDKLVHEEDKEDKE